MVMAIKKFPNIRRFSWNSTKQQKWNTEVQRSASGRVRTMTSQLYPCWTITASLPAITDAEANTLQGFVASLKGSYEPFLWLDPEDYEVKGIKLVPIDGIYQCVLIYGDYRESVEYVDKLKVYVDGVEVEETWYSVNNGGISFLDPLPDNAVVTADYTYYWKVMLADDGLTVTKIFQNINKASLKLVVAR